MDRAEQSVINGDLVFGGYITISNALFYNPTTGIIALHIIAQYLLLFH
jgi:hypothetical protein